MLSVTTLKLDLVIKSRDRVFVVDVTVGLEYRDSLTPAHLEEQQKYAPLLPLVMRDFAVTLGEVISGVIRSLTGLKKLGVRAQKALVDLSLVALRTSIDNGRGHQLRV